MREATFSMRTARFSSECFSRSSTAASGGTLLVRSRHALGEEEGPEVYRLIAIEVLGGGTLPATRGWLTAIGLSPAGRGSHHIY